MIFLDFLDNTFTYDGQSSTKYGLYFLSMNVEEPKVFGGVKSYSSQFLKRSHRKAITKSEYNEDSCLSFDAEIFSHHVISDEYFEDIFSWLFEESNYKVLTIDSDKYLDIYFNCTFNKVEVIKGGIDNEFGVVGFKFTVNCDSPFGWQHEETTITNKGKVVFGRSLLPKDYIYPMLTINLGTTGGNISIANTSDSNSSIEFEELSPASTIVMTPEFNKIEYSGSGNIWALFKSNDFFRLMPGVNELNITGDITSIKIEYEGARLV